jgi:integral membrane protein (TIGR00529 family)
MNALLYTLGVFALILILARLKLPLALSIAVGAFIIGFLFGLDGGQVVLTAFTGAVQPQTIGLVVVTMLILSLSAIMQVAGQFTEIVSLAKLLVRRPAVAMAALPALIGLLPMPGGALFSAPMVETAAADSKVSGSILSAINYWFRHIWEHWWPLYPGVMLAMTLTGLPYARFAAFQIPMGIFMLLTGLLLFRKTHPDLHIKSSAPPAGTKRRFLLATFPIWIVMLVWGPVKYLISLLILPLLPQGLESVVEKYLPLVIALITSIVCIVVSKKLNLSTVAKSLNRKSNYTIACLVISVMVFQYMLSRVGAAVQIADELIQLKVPVVLVVATLPFIAGMVTGLAIGFVGTSFPIVLALVAALPDHGSMYPYVALAYGFGHMGQMVSPLHLCHVVSNEYFKTGFNDVYRRLIPVIALDAVLVAAYFTVLKIII